MGRYTGPKEKLSRREGVELYLKGERALNGKSALERRGPVPPGQHGNARRRRPSIYAEQLRAKQRAKRYYGVREAQFRKYVREAAKKGITGEELLRLLERRLDNVVYRLGLSTSRAQARQLVRHGHFTVNGRKVDIPSYSVKASDVIGVRSTSAENAAIVHAMEEVKGRGIPEWLSFDAGAMTGRVVSLPTREQINLPVQEQLIVELYSK